MIFKNSSFLMIRNSEILNFKSQKFKNGHLRFPRFPNFSNLKINTLESLLILFPINSYYFPLIHGLIASFWAFCSALGSWLMASSSLVARRSAPVPFPGPGPALLLATRLEPAISHQPRAERNAKNEAIRP